MSIPKVSVLMPVYNGEQYVGAAIDSVLRQTFGEFELIVIDDGSTDGSAEIVRSYQDSRIVFFQSPENTGLARVRNRGFGMARGEYLAWLDCDDLSTPTRLEKQVALLDANPGIGMCGTWVKTLGGKTVDVWRYPTDPGFLRARMLFDNPIATSSLMMRMQIVHKHALQFSLNHPPAEDYELWERISRDYGITNIPEVLTQYRLHAMQTSVLKAEKQRAAIWAVQACILAELGIHASETERALHLGIGSGWRFSSDLPSLKQTEEWLLKIEAANCARKIFDNTALKRVLAERWTLAVNAITPSGRSVWRAYNRSELSNWSERPTLRAARLAVLCTWRSLAK